MHCIFGYANILPEHYAEYTIFYETVGFSSNVFSQSVSKPNPSAGVTGTVNVAAEG